MTVFCNYGLQIEEVVSADPEQDVDEGTQRLEQRRARYGNVKFGVTVLNPTITPSQSARVELVFTNPNDSPAGVVGIKDPPEPLTSQSAFEGFDEETDQYENPVLLLVPVDEYDDVERAPGTCWKPQRDGFWHFSTPYLKVPAESSVRIPHEAWASPADKTDGIQPGTYEFVEDFGRFTVCVDPTE